MVRSGAIDINIMIDSCCENIDKSSKRRNKFAKFTGRVANRMSHYVSLIRKTTLRIKDDIKNNLYDEYKDFIDSNLEYFEFMNSPQWDHYITRFPHKNTISTTDIRKNCTISFESWLKLNEDKISYRMRQSSYSKMMFDKRLLMINRSPLVRHPAYIDFEKDPLAFKESDVIVPAYMPLV